MNETFNNSKLIEYADEEQLQVKIYAYYIEN